MAVMAPRDTWTDERLDDFRAETHREFTAVRTEVRDGFARVDKRLDAIDKRFDKIDERFDKIDERFEKVDEEFVAVRNEMKAGFESQHRIMVQGIIGISATIMAGFGAVAGVLAAVA